MSAYNNVLSKLTEEQILSTLEFYKDFEYIHSNDRKTILDRVKYHLKKKFENSEYESPHLIDDYFYADNHYTNLNNKLDKLLDEPQYTFEDVMNFSDKDTKTLAKMFELDYSDRFVNERIYNVLFFLDRIMGDDRDYLTNDDNDEIDKTYLGGDYTQKFFKRFSRCFWAIGTELEIKGNFVGTSFYYHTDAPEVKFYSGSNTEFTAFYENENNSVVINDQFVNPQNIENGISRLFENSKRIGTKISVRAFKNSLPSDVKELIGDNREVGSLIHELSHAWRSNSQNEEILHENIILTIDGQRKNYLFDDAAYAIFRKIELHGFWERVLRMMV